MRRTPLLRLHAPAAHRAVLDCTEDDVLHQQADHDDREKAGEDFRDVELVLAFEDVPTEATFAGGDPEDEFGGDQSAPGESPPDLEAGENGGGRGRGPGGESKAPFGARR